MSTELSENLGSTSHKGGINKSTDEESSQTNSIQFPKVSLPKGGGAIQGIGEKFQTNSFNGTASMTVPIYTSPGRHGFNPELSISYSSGAGNGIFGFGWSLSIPSITRKTDKGLPKYQDDITSDVFILSGAEDLVPQLTKAGEKDIVPNKNVGGVSYEITRYRPRTEGLFARIERWRRKSDGDIHWRSITKENITSIYGFTAQARKSSKDEKRTFSWLIEQTFDDKGNLIKYDYKKENEPGADHSTNRTSRKDAVNTYIKGISYGNTDQLNDEYFLSPDYQGEFFFKVVFDYGDHSNLYELQPDQNWKTRKDCFSSYRSGFEIRTSRLCKKVLMFHHFPNKGLDNQLVRSTTFDYNEQPELSRLISIVQTGYNGDHKKSLPPVHFEYSSTIDLKNPQVERIDYKNLENLPQGLSGPYQLNDLNGEGIPGIMVQQAGNWFYKSAQYPQNPEKTPEYGAITSLPSLPHPLNLDQVQMMDLNGNGLQEVVSLSKALPGYFERVDDGSWHDFKNFQKFPNIDWQNPNQQLVDLTGDGLADILITEDDKLVYFESLATDGWGEGIVRTNQQENGIPLIFDDGTNSIYLTDMTGDGLSDLVRIRNGSIVYWPNLGYGAFGDSISCANAPLFDSDDMFRQDRIKLYDTDGTGTTDLIYTGQKETILYLNQCGNGFRDGIVIRNAPVFDDMTQVRIADLRGNGTGCLLWSTPLSNHIHFIDLMGGQKPHLLTKISNGMGGETHITYQSSTHYYLKDKMNGKPWITRLPFPVQVVEKVTIKDLITNSTYTTTYQYAHGYYDGEEREFRGFGRVEQDDIETYQDENVDQHPVKTISWFHTGAWRQNERIECYFKDQEYFFSKSNNEDQVSSSGEYHFYSENWLLQDTVIPDKLAIEEEKEAVRSLRGSMLRQEVYALDGSEQQGHPYLVTESNYLVETLQNKSSNEHGVFYSRPNESISFHYERDIHDPRIQHQFTLQVDTFGNVEKNVTVAYPRFNPQKRESDAAQINPLCTYVESRFTQITNEDFKWVHSVPIEVKTWEISAHNAIKDYSPSTIENVRHWIEGAFKPDTEETPYVASINTRNPGRKLVQHIRSYYANRANQRLELGTIQLPILPYESHQKALTNDIIISAFGESPDLRNLGKYVFDDGAWWAPSGNTRYNDFYLPYLFIDPFSENEKDNSDGYHTDYDDYNLLVESITDPLGNSNCVKNDYRILQPYLMKDLNNNETKVAFDALGMVVATAIIGKPNTPLDNLSGFNANLNSTQINDYLNDPSSPLSILKNATSCVVYDLHRFTEKGKPICMATIARENHSNPQSSVQRSFLYQDGLGRELQTKGQAEPEKVILTNADGTFLKIESANRWIGTGSTIYNNKGNPVKQFEPFFSDTHLCQPSVEYGVSTESIYDPVGRVMGTNLPDDTFTKVGFNAWKHISYDQIDTLDSENNWYKKRINAEDRKIRHSATRSIEHADTPSIAHLDTLGRVYKTIADNGSQGQFITRTLLDIQGNTLQITDPLWEKYQSDPMKRRGPAMVSQYDMTGNAIRSDGMDSGDRKVLYDVGGNPIKTWDANGNIIEYEYDRLRRPTYKYLITSKDRKPIEHFRYGTDISKNLNGQISEQWDGAGKVTYVKFDVKGNLLHSYRQLSKTKEQVPKWEDLSKIDDEKFEAITEYDALNRAVTVKNFINNELRYTTQNHYNEAGLLDKVRVAEGDEKPKEKIQKINYNEKGQRISIFYANGVKTTFQYDEQTFRLTHLRSTKKPHSGIQFKDLLQDIHYTYDAVGNLTAIEDKARETFYHDGNKLKPVSRFRYDALYQLIEAEGREHIGQNSHTRDQYRDIPSIPLIHGNDAKKMRYYKQTYTYDINGNIKNMAHRVGDNSNHGWTRDYSYEDESNKLIETTGFNGYAHDANGNLSKLPHLPEMVWDHHDRLIKTKKTLGSRDATHYQYDASGMRVLKRTMSGADWKEYVYLGNMELYRVFDNTNSIRNERQTLHLSSIPTEAGDQTRFGLMEKQTIGTDSYKPHVERYQLNNHLGSSHLESDENGEEISYEEYHPFGSSSVSTRNPKISKKRYRYSGKEKDEETGLYYYGARYYLTIGRWCSPDPAGFVDGVNVYGFVRNNPLNQYDKLGKNAIDIATKEKENRKFIIRINNLSDSYIDKTHQDLIAQKLKDDFSFLNEEIQVDVHFGEIDSEPDSEKQLTLNVFLIDKTKDHLPVEVNKELEKVEFSRKEIEGVFKKLKTSGELGVAAHKLNFKIKDLEDRVIQGLDPRKSVNIVHLNTNLKTTHLLDSKLIATEEIHDLASTISHELGHAFGLGHHKHKEEKYNIHTMEKNYDGNNYPKGFTSVNTRLYNSKGRFLGRQEIDERNHILKTIIKALQSQSYP